MKILPKLFLDTNVLLDFLLQRDGWEDVARLIDLACREEIRCYCSYLSVADIAYIVRKTADAEGVRTVVRELMSWCEVMSPSSMDISMAVKTPHPDFEDSLQILSAEQKDCDVIVTNNLKHFVAYTDVPVMSCSTLIDMMRH